MVCLLVHSESSTYGKLSSVMMRAMTMMSPQLGEEGSRGGARDPLLRHPHPVSSQMGLLAALGEDRSTVTFLSGTSKCRPVCPIWPAFLESEGGGRFTRCPGPR